VLALAGIKVVSLAVNIPGPVLAARLVELGASVVKIEPPAGDPLFDHAPRWYARLTGSQRILRLDAKSREGEIALAELLAEADLVITASRSGALKRLGLDFASLHGRFPRLCQLQIVGFPAPDDDRPGHDLNFQAAAGLITDPPRMPSTLLADLVGAERGVAEALALLLHRERTGEAGFRQVALATAAEALALPIELGLCRPGAPLGGAQPGYAIYPAKDGFVALAALEPHFLAKLQEALELPEVTAARLRKVLRSKRAAHWEAWGRRHGIPLTKLRVRGSTRRA
jgi:crotonobetainyl-CoA:carnitine CoA-transferase CaiB-like acyl-CoA transferase